MKFRFHWAQALVLGLALLAAGCLEQDPYDKFAGTWVFGKSANGEAPLVALDLDTAHRKLGITVLMAPDSMEEWMYLELPIQSIEMRDGSLALSVDNTQIANERRLPMSARFGSLLLEPLDDDALLAKPYLEEIPAKDLLGRNAPRPQEIEELKRPDREQKRLLSQIEPDSDRLKRDWYIEGSWDKPALSFDAESGKVKLRNTELIKRRGESMLTPAAFIQGKMDGEHIMAVLFANTPTSGGDAVLAMNLDKQPPETVLGLRGERFPLLPEMSGVERQRYARAKEDARREAARQELEAKRQAEAEAAEARRVAEERQRKADEEARIAAEKARVAEEARQKELAEKRARMPQFSFGDIRLTDTPQQMVQKGLERYKLATSFPVQQKDGSIANVKNPSIGYLPFLLQDPGISEALGGKERVRMNVPSRYRQMGSETTGGFVLGPDKMALEAGVRPDILILQDKTRNDPTSTAIEIGFFTLPGKAPTPYYLNVDGDIVVDAVSVFKERYGEPENVVSDGDTHQYLWRSGNELAILKVDPQNPNTRQHHELYIVSLPAYAELEKFTQDLRQAEEAKKKAAEEAERARKKAEQDARKAGI
ncbi:MAG: cell envelope integrity protein TolA [Desulfovibrio sp.]|nr:cell envelope integrity protein TolA [Desulfovibrio sp.]